LSKKLLTTNIRRYLVISILLTIAKIAKGLQDFSTHDQFSLLYQHTKYLGNHFRTPCINDFVKKILAYLSSFEYFFVILIYFLSLYGIILTIFIIPYFSLLLNYFQHSSID